jgi:TIR domain-containing protein/pentapeptide repeat protein
MANPEHLKILKQGVEHWNQWRKENPEIKLDLSGAELRGAILFQADLREVDLSEANLYEANLIAANLERAFLEKTNLKHSKLNGANLSKANLKKANFGSAKVGGANLSQADLKEANFNGVYLFDVNFSGADLSKASLYMTIFLQSKLDNANLTASTIGRTSFLQVDFSQTKGLKTCKHMEPSSIDHRTLIRSGKLPEVFLRGCGFPDQFIEHLPGLLGSLDPIQFYSCFISYSSKDDEFARRLHADLQANNVRCWFAPEDMKIGDKIRPRIDEVIHVHDKLLLVLSEESVNSEWVEKEVETAFEKERERKETVLFPIRLDDAVMDIKTGWPADIRRSRHIGDFTNWKDHDSFKKAFDRLLKDLGKEE